MVVVVETAVHRDSRAGSRGADAKAPRQRSKSPSLRGGKPEARTPTPSSGSGRGSTIPAHSVRSITPVSAAAVPVVARRGSVTAGSRPTEPTQERKRSRSQSERTMQSQKLHAQRVRSGLASPVCEKKKAQPKPPNPTVPNSKLDKKTHEQAQRAWARNKERLEIAQQRLHPHQAPQITSSRVETQSVSSVSVEEEEAEKCGRSSACPTMVYSPLFELVTKEVIFPDIGTDCITERQIAVRMNPDIASLYADVSMVIPINQPRTPQELQFEDWVEEEVQGDPNPCCVLTDLLPMEDSGDNHLGIAIVAVEERATQYDYVDFARPASRVEASPELDLRPAHDSPDQEVHSAAVHSTGSICTADVSSIPKESDHRSPDRAPEAKITSSEAMLRGSAGSVLESDGHTWSPSVLSPRSDFPISTLTNALKRLNYNPALTGALAQEDKKVLLHRVVQHEHTIVHIEELQRQLERAKAELRNQSAQYWGAISRKP